MPITKKPPLSLYVHIPWCVRKCPYCDFNSHEHRGELPETAYVTALLQEIDEHLPMIRGRPLISIFIGGGTPSLFSPSAIEQLLNGIAARLSLAKNVEISLEANPGTIDQPRFQGFRSAGVNRLSLGIQSLQNDKLKILGRIHDRDTALHAISVAKKAGFTNFNVDFMFGLPQQTCDEALSDLRDALAFEPTHVSWYQLTIEPNTVFYKKPPSLPPDDAIWEMQLAGSELLAQHDFKPYEVSAYSRSLPCVHNRNYWEFGDYLGIGAGAHSKLTDPTMGEVTRFAKVRQPRDYLDQSKSHTVQVSVLTQQDLVFEFMLNALRLTAGVPLDLFVERTGVSLEVIAPTLQAARARTLLVESGTQLRTTDLGKRFLNDLVGMFLS